jgi:hypothetical protein
MYRQQSQGHAYLYRETSKDQCKSVGPRTSETEKIHAEVKSGKAAAEQRFSSIGARLLRTYSSGALPVLRCIGAQSRCLENSMRSLRTASLAAVVAVGHPYASVAHVILCSCRGGEVWGNTCVNLIAHRSLPDVAFLKLNLGNANQRSVWSEASFAPRLTGGALGMLAKIPSVDRSFGCATSAHFLYAANQPTRCGPCAVGRCPG